MNKVISLVTEFLKTVLENIPIFISNTLKNILPKVEVEFGLEFKVKVKKRETES